MVCLFAEPCSRRREAGDLRGICLFTIVSTTALACAGSLAAEGEGELVISAQAAHAPHVLVECLAPLRARPDLDQVLLSAVIYLQISSRYLN